jgi:hypothetical protein
LIPETRFPGAFSSEKWRSCMVLDLEADEFIINALKGGDYCERT